MSIQLSRRNLLLCISGIAAFAAIPKTLMQCGPPLKVR